MRAVMLPGNREVEVVDRDVPIPGPGEVLIRTRASAICRSDMSLYTGNPIVGTDTAGKGMVAPGHEPAGEVAEVGPGVTGLAPGDRVAVHLAIGCGSCAHCQAGFYMLCTRLKVLGFDVDGGDADFFVVPERNCLPLPDELSFVTGALMTDMIGTQFNTQQRLGVRGGQTIAVVGLGPMGAAAVAVAHGLGSRVVAVDVLDERLKLASRLGADHLINNSSTDAAAEIAALTAGRGVDVAIDCSGAPSGQNLALDVAAKQGGVAFVGESQATQINPSDQVIRKLLTVLGGWYFPVWQWADIVRFVQDRAVPVEDLVTHRFSLEEAPEAFRSFEQHETEKAVFVWDPPTTG